MAKKNKIDVGEAVGIVAAQSIGEPGTQMSIPYSEKVLVSHEGKTKAVEIGEFIDSAFERFGFSEEKGHQICDLPIEVLAPSLNQNEKIEWKKVSALSRHKSPPQLICIYLRSGRKITATPFHSFVIRKRNCIVPVAGSSLKPKDRLPVLKNLPECKAASQVSVDAKQALKEKLKHMVCSNGMLYAYPREGSKPMPCELELGKQLGWLAGIYIAEGNAMRNFLSISNTNGKILERVRRFADSYGFTYNEYDNFRGFAPAHDIRINSTLMSQLFKSTCGQSSHKKCIPDFAYNAPQDFIASLLRGYFDGDGSISVSRKVIRASSKSKELIDGLCMLLARLGIFASKRSDKKSHNLSISYRYAGRFLELIGSDREEKKRQLETLSSLSLSQGYNLVDVIPGIGEELSKAACLAGIPSRLTNNFRKRGYVGRSTLVKYISLIESAAKKKKIHVPQLAMLQRAAQSHVVWDEIEKIEHVETAHQYVYDFTVPGTETFTTFEGVITHNTMRTFHYAGVAEQVPTGLPRLIELVDARKEPKKPIMDIYLKDEFSSSYDKAKEAAKRIERTTLNKVAYIEENFAEKRITITVEQTEIDAEGVKMDEIRRRVKSIAGSHMESKDNTIIVKPTASSLKNIRRMTNRLRQLHIKGIEKIKRTIVVKGKDGKYFIRTAGSNLATVIKNQKVDAKRTYTNDIQEIARVLGIEAARNALVNEIKQVLSMQNLNVDIRHCMLLADAMTMDGEIKSIGRHGLSGGKAGVLARAAFEETVKHLINAAVRAEEDKLIGVTENIIIGQTVPVGTGLVKLKMKL